MIEEFSLAVREEAASLGDDEMILMGYGPSWTATTVATHSLGRALCRLLAGHMPEPVDPLILEARKLVAARRGNCYEYVIGVLSGDDDDSQAVQNCLAAIKRGMELARESKP